MADEKKKTKRVDGEDLEKSAFAYRPDDSLDNWKLPIEFSSEAKTKSHIRNAVARFDQTDMPDADEKKKAWTRIEAAAKKHGVEISEDDDKEKKSSMDLPLLSRDASVEIVTRKRSQEEIDRRKAERKAKAKAAGQDGDDPDDEDEEDDDEERTISLSLASEAPVERWFGQEILDMRGADLSRATDGLPFLLDHRTDKQIGVLENVRIEGGKLRAEPRFSRSKKAQQVRQDMLDGIRTKTSIGYRARTMKLEEESETKGDTYRVTDWILYEGSSVAVPADPTVGVGRSEKDKSELRPVMVQRSANTASRAAQEIRVMADEKKAATASEVLTLCKQHGVDSERGASWVDEGLTLDQVSTRILDEVAKKGNKPLNASRSAEELDREGQRNMLDLTEKEQQEYSVVRAVNCALSDAENGKAEKCFEREVSDELAKRHEGKSHGGIFVPYKIGIDPVAARSAAARIAGLGISRRAGLDTQTVTKGHELVFTEPGSFLQYLYNAMRVKQAGARTTSGLTGNVSWPKQTGKATGSWVSENPGTDVGDSNLTLGNVPSSPKTYQSSSSYSRQLLAQAPSANVDIDMLVRTDLARDCALAIDFAALNGDGTGGSPTGVRHTSNVQSYTLHGDSGNGAKPDYQDIVAMQTLLENVNADQLGDAAWITTPGIKGLLKQTARLANTIGLPIWMDGNTVDGLDAFWTNQLPSNLTEGSGSNLAVILLGVWAELMIGMWGSGFELIVDPYRLKKQGMIEITTFQMVDTVLLYPQAFIDAEFAAKS